MNMLTDLLDKPVAAESTPGYRYKTAEARYFPFNQLVDEDIFSRTALASAVANATRAGRRSFVTINNKAEGRAPLSVIRLAEEIARISSPDKLF